MGTKGQEGQSRPLSILSQEPLSRKFPGRASMQPSPSPSSSLPSSSKVGPDWSSLKDFEGFLGTLQCQTFHSEGAGREWRCVHLTPALLVPIKIQIFSLNLGVATLCPCHRES